MTRLFNQGWINFDGGPTTGKVPTETVVYSAPGVEMSAEQLGAVLHAYKLFCDAIKVSALPAGYHVQNRQYPDGTRVRMTSNLEVHTVRVWLPGEGVPQFAYRGFIIKPLWTEDGTPVLHGSTAWKTTLVKYVSDDALWKKWIRPYQPGKDGGLPSYFVDHLVTAKDKYIKSDQRYADVYTLHEDKLFKNGRPFTKLVHAYSVPVVLHHDPTTTGPTVLLVGDGGVEYVDSTPAAIYAWQRDIELEVLVPGTVYTAGVRYDRAEEKARFVVLNITGVPVMQRWNAEVTLTRDAPWMTAVTTFDQYGLPSDLISDDEYVADTVALATPWSPIVDPDATRMGYYYTLPTTNTPVVTAPSGPIYGDGIGTDDEAGRYTYSATLYDNGNLPSGGTTFDDVAVTFSRSAVINNVLQSGTITWENKWPNAPCWMAISTPSEAEYTGYGFVRMTGSGLDDPGLGTGDLHTIAMTQEGGFMVHTDVAVSAMTVTGPWDLFDVTATHTITQTETTSVEQLPEAGASLSATWAAYFKDPPGEYVSTGWGGANFPSKTNGPARYYLNHNVGLSISAIARDYLYFDKENEVYVCMESVLTGTSASIDSGTEAGTATVVDNDVTLTMRLRLSWAGGEVYGPIRSFSTIVTGVRANMAPPDNVNFGTSDFVWDYVSLEQPLPIFAPAWCHQGLCPYIAYTTVEEAAAVGTPFTARLMASFKIQVQFIGIEFLHATLPEAQTVNLPMLEQMLNHHWDGIWYTSLEQIPAEAFTLNTVSPGSDIHTDLGITGANPLSEFYRT